MQAGSHCAVHGVKVGTMLVLHRSWKILVLARKEGSQLNDSLVTVCCRLAPEIIASSSFSTQNLLIPQSTEHITPWLLSLTILGIPGRKQRIWQ